MIETQSLLSQPKSIIICLPRIFYQRWYIRVSNRILNTEFRVRWVGITGGGGEWQPVSHLKGYDFSHREPLSGPKMGIPITFVTTNS